MNKQPTDTNQAGAHRSVYMPRNPPPKPEFVSLPSKKANDSDPLQAVDNKKYPAITEKLHEGAHRYYRAEALEFCERVKTELEQSRPSVIPGIPRNHVYPSQKPCQILTPKDIWSLRHLKPLQRKQTHTDFWELCGKLCDLDIEDAAFWDLLAVLKKKTSVLHDGEKSYHRIHMRRMFMTGEYDKSKLSISWETRVKFQSFDTRLDEDGRVQIARHASPT